jgi:predicted permease
MSNVTVLLPAIIPVSFVILVGLIAGKTLQPDAQGLAKLSLYVTFPALIADALSQANLSLQSSVGLILGFCLVASLLYGFAFCLGRWAPFTADQRKSLIATTLFANTGNLGLPFITFALGKMGLERALIYLITGAIVMTCIAPALLQGKGLGFGLRFTLKLPIFWATIGGLFLRFWAIQLPFNLGAGITLLGDAAIPLALITLGVQLATTQFQFGWYELGACGLRLVLGPLVAYGVGTLLRLDTLDLQVLVLQGAMPTAVSCLVWVKAFGGDAPRVANTIVLSTLLGLVTLPIVLWLITS